jgi:hypothetical protein
MIPFVRYVIGLAGEYDWAKILNGQNVCIYEGDVDNGDGRRSDWSSAVTCVEVSERDRSD